jgi:hypothetical protein
MPPTASLGEITKASLSLGNTHGWAIPGRG